jgi:hypothetical protein
MEQIKNTGRNGALVWRNKKTLVWRYGTIKNTDRYKTLVDMEQNTGRYETLVWRYGIKKHWCGGME